MINLTNLICNKFLIVPKSNHIKIIKFKCIDITQSPVLTLIFILNTYIL